jgi:hypothetical protein
LYKAIGRELQKASEATQDATIVGPREPGPSLYDDVVRLGIKHASHYSDLYLPCTPEVIELLARHGKHVDGWNVSRFTNQVEGGTWLDVPFAYKPYWDSRSK